MLPASRAIPNDEDAAGVRPGQKVHSIGEANSEKSIPRCRPTNTSGCYFIQLVADTCILNSSLSVPSEKSNHGYPANDVVPPVVLPEGD